MAFVMMEEGALKVLVHLKATQADSDWIGALFANDVTPDVADTLDTYTLAEDIEPITEFGTEYGDPVGDGLGKAVMTAALVTWLMTAATSQTLYGYVIYDTDDTLILAERFATPQPVADLGTQIKVTNLTFKVHS